MPHARAGEPSGRAHSNQSNARSHMKHFRLPSRRRRAPRSRRFLRHILAAPFAAFLFSTAPLASAATVTWQGDLSGSWGAGTAGLDTNWVGNPLPGTGDSLSFDLTTAAVANLSTTNDLTGLVLGGTAAITFTNDAGTGGFTLAGNDVTLGGNITSVNATGTHTHTISLGLILNGNRTVTALSGTTIAIDGIISETGGARNFIKAGAGTATLSAANTFTGAISINQGVLSVNTIADGGTASALGAGTVINLGNAAQTGTLTYTGTGGSTNRTVALASTGAGGGTINSSGTGALVFTGTFTNAGTGAKTLTLGGSNAGANEIQSVIGNGSGTLALVKTANGAWTLSAANTFTGDVSINQGTLSVNTVADSGTASALGAGTVINLGSGAQTGTLLYTGAGGSTNRTVALASTAAGGGTITASGTGALVFTGAFSNAGSTAKTFTLNGSSTAANEFQSALVDNTGGALTVVKSGAGAWTLSGTSSFTGALSAAQGTLSISSIANGGVNSAAGAGSLINIGSGTTTAGTLTYTGTGGSTNRTISLAATTTGAATINSSGTGALVLTGTFTNAGTGAKILTLGGTNTGANEIQSVIANGSGTLSITKADAGTWALSGANTHSGGTTLSAGTLALNNAGTASASAIGTGTLTITGGTLDNTSGAALTLATNNPVSLNGSLAFGGTDDLALGTGVVTIGNANRDITLNGSRTLTLGELQWNSVNGSRTLTVNQGTGSGAKLVLGGFQLNINADTAARNRTINGSGSVEITAPVANGNTFANGLIYSGTGTLTLSAANSYTGSTIVSGGTLRLGGSGAISSSSSLVINAGTVDVRGTAAGTLGALTLDAATTTAGGLTASLVSTVAGGSFTPAGSITYNAGSAGFENGQATVSADLVLTADRTITVNDSPVAALDVLISGIVSGGFGFTKANGGTLRLTGANTFTGQAGLNNGTTEVTVLADIGLSGSLGTGDKDAAAGILRFGNGASTGTLSYIGAGDTTNRRVQIGTGTGAASSGGASILSNGTGALTFSASAFNSPVSVGATGPAAARTLTLGGANTGGNSIQGAIVNNTGAGTAGTNAVGITKQDAGRWELAGASTYTGPTSVGAGTLVVTGTLSGTSNVDIHGGTLLLNGSNRINSAAPLALDGGTFATGGNSEGSAAAAGLGLLSLTASSVLDFGSGTGSILHFSGLGTHAAGTVLSILNFDGSGSPGDDRLIFSGTTSDFTALYAQADVTFNGASGYAAIQFDAGNYEIVPVPEPASTALLGVTALCALIGWRERKRTLHRLLPRSQP